MKNILVLTYLFITIHFITAQSKKPLIGSGNVVNKSFNATDFDKVNILDFDGVVEIEIGKPYSISVDIDDNLVSDLEFFKNKEDQAITLQLKENKNGKRYLENTNIKIKVSLPICTAVRHRGNTSVTISGVNSDRFELDQQGNGDIILEGKTGDFDVSKIGNGSVKAKTLVCETANVKALGNGNVSLNVSKSIRGNGAGNGDIILYGAGETKAFSGVAGNGKLVRR